jgi:hypothetical protein
MWEFGQSPMFWRESSVLWDIMTYSLLKVNWCFGEMCCLHFQGQRISQARNQHEASSRQRQFQRMLAASFLLDSLFDPEFGGDMWNMFTCTPDLSWFCCWQEEVHTMVTYVYGLYVPQKHWDFFELHSVTVQKTLLFRNEYSEVLHFYRFLFMEGAGISQSV